MEDINRKKIIIIQECLSLKHLNCPVDSPELETGFFWFSVCCGKGRKKHEFALFRARQFSFFSRFLSAIARKKRGRPSIGYTTCVSPTVFSFIHSFVWLCQILQVKIITVAYIRRSCLGLLQHFTIEREKAES